MPVNAFLLDVSVKATIMLAASSLLASAMRRGSSSTRYFTWTCVLAAVLVLPPLSRILPGWSLPSSPSTVTLQSTISEDSPMIPAGTSTEPPIVRTPRLKQWPLIVWFAGFLIAFSRLVIGHLRLAWALRGTTSIRIGNWIAERDEIASLLGLRRRIPLLLSMAADVPLTCGNVRAARGFAARLR